MSDNFHGLPGITVGLSSTATPRLGLLFLAYAWWGRKLEGHFKKQDINSHLKDLRMYEKEGPQKVDSYYDDGMDTLGPITRRVIARCSLLAAR
jgi:hypothetical protein